MSLKTCSLFFSLSLLLSCGKPPAPKAPYTPTLAEPDWAKLTEESTSVLQSLIKIPSISPPPEGSQGELLVAQRMAELLKSEGIEPMVVESAPGRGNVMARLKGDGSKKPIILLCHIDVVSVEKANWKVDPFEGVIKDGYIFRSSL
jgi:acetylornithine deacetylase/succinyl-diaminopimelate desuccinylase-like protein